METVLTKAAKNFLSEFEKLISTSNWPYFYYEWAILLRIRDKQFMHSEIHDESHNYPNVHQVLQAIKTSIEQPDEKLYPKVLQEWINDMSKLCLEVRNRNNEINIKRLMKRLEEGGHCNQDVPKYYQLCVEGFRKVGRICEIYPSGSTIISKAAGFGSHLFARGGMSDSQYLHKLLDMDVEKLTKKAIHLIHLAANQKESKTLEFKSSFIYDIKGNRKDKLLKKECTKTIASFLNSHGGILLVGVDDNGKILGLAKDIEYSKNNDDKFILSFKDAVKNSLGVSVLNNVDWSLEDVGGCKKALIVEVKPATFPCWHGNEFFIRNNPSSDRVLSVQDFNEYTSSRFGSSSEYFGVLD
tara:strand:- start:127 stop:1191 length:1065 start_codon:yes stop_codon:yes gene_type:complete